MDWLKRLFEFGRLKADPEDHTAGRALRPASARTQLGLKEVDLPRGVVTLRDGSVRCFLEVTGFAAHHRSAADARAWLQGYATALNTLPGNAVLLVRSKPGGLEHHIAGLKRRTSELAEEAPGSALARLAADQLGSARALEATGQVRQTEQFVALHSPKGDVDRLLSAAEACRRHLEASGVRAHLVADRGLARALADDWRPAEVEPAWIAMELEREIVGAIDYTPKHAEFVDARDVAKPVPRRAPEARVAEAKKELPG
jgi:hypothetical protein